MAETRALVPLPLPPFQEPKTLSAAAKVIERLGTSMHQHAYLVGKHLAWAKKAVGHGSFLAWVENNVWFCERTARHFMLFASRCDGEDRLLEYHPKSATVADVDQPRFPENTYQVILADPPWKYVLRAQDETHRARCPYPMMETEAICELPVATVAAPDCVLWLWTTNAHMRKSFEVIEAWGFEAKTILTWEKHAMGCGNWLRGKTEHCHLAVRGHPVVRLTNQTTSLHGKVREHSRKPDEFYDLVDSLCTGPRIELFAREARKGWDFWGNEVGKFDGG